MVQHTNPSAQIPSGGRARVIAKTSNHTVTAGESGTIFTNEGAIGAVSFTLPAPAEGLHYSFYCAEAQNLLVIAPDADSMVVFNDVAATEIAFNTTNEIAGGMLYAFSDGAKWMVAEQVHDNQTTVIA